MELFLKITTFILHHRRSEDHAHITKAFFYQTTPAPSYPDFKVGEERLKAKDFNSRAFWSQQ